MLKLLTALIISFFCIILIYPCSIFNKNDGINYLIGKNEDWLNPGYVQYLIEIHKAETNLNGCLIFNLRYYDKYDYPYDGINDKGLYCGECSVPKVKVSFSSLKPKINSCDIIKLVLQKCSTVDEALEEFKKYSIDFVGDYAVHYMVADKSGKSVIIEFVGKEMLTYFKDKNYQCMTNFYFSNVYAGSYSWNGKDRYVRMTEKLKNNDPLSIDYAMSILQSVKQNSGEYDNTITSTVYDVYNSKIYLVYKRDFKRIRCIDLNEELKKGDNKYKLDEN